MMVDHLLNNQYVLIVSCAHKHRSKDRIQSLSPIFLSPLSVSVLSLVQSLCVSSQPNSSCIPAFQLLFLVSHTCTLFSVPPMLFPGCHCISVGGEHHPCLTSLYNHTPILLLLPLQSRPVHPTRPIHTSSARAGHHQLVANRNKNVLLRSRGYKAAQQQ